MSGSNELVTIDFGNEGINRRLTENFLKIQDYFFEVSGFQYGMIGQKNDADYKGLPYHDIQSLLKIQTLGNELFKSSLTAKNIHENLISYIVGKGHTYEVLPVDEKADKKGDTFKKAQAAIDRVTNDLCWPVVQEEFYNRWFRTGETFQYVEGDEFAFIEPHLVYPPRGGKERKFGIEFEDGRFNRPSRYWVKPTYSEKAEPEQADVIIHSKRGVDRNDPRGVPLLWAAYCPCNEIDELEYALTYLLVAVAENAVSYDYDDSRVDGGTVRKIAEGAAARKEQVKLEGKPNDAGRAVQAHRFKVEINAGGIDANAFIEAKNSKARRISGIAGIPEFIITGDADTGSRNSLFAAEGPLVRRTAREAQRGSKQEMEFLYRVAAQALGYRANQEGVNKAKKILQIRAKVPIVESEDKKTTAERHDMQLANRTKSPQMVIRENGDDPEEVVKEWAEWEDTLAKMRETHGDTVFMDAAELETRIRAARTLKDAGWDPDEAMEKVGLDPIEHRAMVDEQVIGFPGNVDPRNPNPEGDQTGASGGDPRQRPGSGQATAA